MTKTKSAIKIAFFFLGLLLFFLIFTFVPKNYEYSYIVDDVQIIESYDKKEDIYTFNIKVNDIDYMYSLSSKYYAERGIIDQVKVNDSCITARSNKLHDFSLCYHNNEFVTSFYSQNIDNLKKTTYENVDIFDLNGKKFYVWNYTEFLAISAKGNERIELFSNDIYKLDLITKLNDYLVLPDYDQKYKFNNLYLINSKNNRVEKVELDKEIYFNSYILGTYKKNIYLYDIQKGIEYKVSPFKERVTKNKYEILVNDQWKEISVNKLNKKNVQFENSENFYYLLEKNQLYYYCNGIKINVTNLPVSSLVYYDDMTAYFVSDDTLYSVNIFNGIQKVMRYTEWRFNSDNIFVF